MKKHCFLVLLATMFLLSIGATGNAALTLDFDTPVTGSNILINPLVTSAGTITASLSGSGSLFLDNDSDLGLTDSFLEHSDNGDNSSYAQLAFDFDVSSLSFYYSGDGSGAFTAKVFDASESVLAEFYDGDTATDNPGGPILFSGDGIRYLRFFDGPDTSFYYSAVDTLTITPSAVPEPTTMLLLGFGLIGLAGATRKKLKK